MFEQVFNLFFGEKEYKVYFKTSNVVTFVNCFFSKYCIK